MTTINNSHSGKPPPPPQQSPPSAKGIIATFASHRVAANLLMFLFILVGLWALKKLNTQFFPNFELDYITINVVWTGASAEDVEESITIPIEQELSSLTDVKRMTSSSRQGTATITLELFEGTETDQVLYKVKQRVESIRNLPEQAERAIIQQIERFTPIANVLITGTQSLQELDHLAHRFEEELLDLGISKITFVGLPTEEIAIEVSSSMLTQTGLSLGEIAQKVKQNSQNLPAGTAAKDAVSKQVRSLNQQKDILGFENLPLSTDKMGRLLRLGDIANVERRPQEDEPYITWKGQPGIEMILMRTESDDTLSMAKIFNQWLAETQKTLPPGVKLHPYNERYKQLRERINLLVTNGAGGLILVIATLFLFLNVRVAFWVTVGIPISFLATLAILHFVGGSINMISLFALIMALGIIVDDAIVVGEDTLTHKEMGEKSSMAAIGGAKRMFAPVLSSSLTTIAAFLPLALVGGIMGKIMFELPTVIICMIIASLVECFLILPGHLLHSLKRSKKDNPNSIHARFDRHFQAFRDNRLRPLVKVAIKYRGTVIVLGVSFFALALSLAASGILKFNFFPTIDGNAIRASVEFHPGTPKSQVHQFVAHVEDALAKTDQQFGGNLVNISLVYHNRSFFTSGLSTEREVAAERGSIIVDLVSGHRPVNNDTFIKAWRKNITLPPGINKFKIMQREMGPGGPPIGYRLIGHDLKSLKQASLELQSALAKFEGITNIDDDLPFGKEQLIYELTPTGRRLGLTTESIGLQLRAAFDGVIAQIFHEQDKEIEVRVSLTANEKDQLKTLENFPVILPSGETTPLSNVVKFSSRQGIEVLRHTDTLLNTTVSADIDENIINANEVRDQIAAEVVPRLKKIYGVKLGLEGKAIDQKETMGDMRTGMLVGLVLIYIVLAWVFASYSWPLAVMCAIPLGLTGAILGHFFLGKDLSMFSMMGLFGLSGIVINDSIVLITFYGQLRAQGQDVYEAITNAICARFRAVLLTSLTTIAGLLPILFETSLQAQFLIPMAISIVFGLAYGTFLILFFIPGLLVYLENGKSRLGLKSRFAHQETATF
ncbi:MAG: efflux RND transporter permease subunit [Pseudomonadales bacterium]|nr:efflux RND transporter permease subunit [Pseudomonadales bacterium]